jgi:hypothetical protein
MSTSLIPANDTELLEVSEGLRALRARTDHKMVVRMETHFVGDTETTWRTTYDASLAPQADVHNARAVANAADERVRRSLRRATRLIKGDDESLKSSLIRQSLGGVAPSALRQLGRRARVLRLRGLIAAITSRTELAGALDELPELTAATEELNAAETALDVAVQAARAAVDARKAAKVAFLKGYKGFVNALRGDPSAPSLDTLLPVFTRSSDGGAGA